MKNERNRTPLKKALEDLLQANISLEHKSKSKSEEKKKLFQTFLNQIEHVIVKSQLINEDFNIDMSKYEESFYQIVDSVILLAWGQEVYEVIYWYLYDRKTPDGEETYLIDPITEDHIYIKNSEELYELLLTTNPKIFK
jgi:hypothetical protein|tara:strand:+ start:211 stop:627 length:417 start_codon:yes stop_codon:yes gene_type:complete